MSYVLLNLVIFLPLMGAALVLAFQYLGRRTVEAIAGAFSILSLLLTLYLWIAWRSTADFQYTMSRSWIAAFNIRYSVGVDGISMPMVILTALLSAVCIYYSFGRVVRRVGEYYFFMLLLECFLLGVFCARDLFLFYVMFDATLIPMYFLIAIWGGEKGGAAALKFLLYTLAGSAALLVGVLWVYFRSAQIPPHQATFDMSLLADTGLFRGSGHLQVILFFLFSVAFLVKIPIFPFHTWLPDAYAESPTPVTAMLAGVMGKMGVYGFLRLALPLFPGGAHAWSRPLMIVGVISIIYGAFAALAQWDLKRLVAYSSVSHMGFVALGIAAASAAVPATGLVTGMDPRTLALSGVVFEMFAHGVITGGLFLLIGMLSDQVGVRDLRSLTGAMKTAPVFVLLFSVFMFATMAMPGLIGFPSELYILLGSFQVYLIPTAISAIGIILTAGFFIWALQRMAFGRTTAVSESLHDLSAREIATIAPLLILAFLFGLAPALFLTPWSPSIRLLVGQL